MHTSHTIHTYIPHTVTGEVFSWGSGRYGRLGHGHLRDRFSPLMIAAPLRGVAVTYIACHENHSAAVAGENDWPLVIDMSIYCVID